MNSVPIDYFGWQILRKMLWLSTETLVRVQQSKFYLLILYSLPISLKCWAAVFICSSTTSRSAWWISTSSTILNKNLRIWGWSDTREYYKAVRRLKFPNKRRTYRCQFEIVQYICDCKLRVTQRVLARLCNLNIGLHSFYNPVLVIIHHAINKQRVTSVKRSPCSIGSWCAVAARSCRD